MNTQYRSLIRTSLLASIAIYIFISGENVVFALEAADKLSNMTFGDTGNGSAIVAPGGNIAFEANRDKKVFKARYARSINSFLFDAILQAPIDDEEKQITTADLDGLANNTSVNAKITKFWGEPIRTKEILEKEKQIFRTAANLLNEEYPKLGVVYDHNYIDKLKAKGLSEYYDLKRRYDEVVDEQLAINVPFFGLSGTIGQKKYSFTDPNTAISDDSSETNYSFGGHAGLLTSNDYLLLAGYRFEKFYKGGKEQDFCTPIEGTSNTTCTSTSLTEPKQIEANILYVEMRKFLWNVAINPKLSYDLEDSITGLECGFYFIPDKKGMLVGGVKTGWNSEDDDFTVTLVLGVPLRLFD
jgi:hypothetical protein